MGAVGSALTHNKKGRETARELGEPSLGLLLAILGRWQDLKGSPGCNWYPLNLWAMKFSGSRESWDPQIWSGSKLLDTSFWGNKSLYGFCL